MSDSKGTSFYNKFVMVNKIPKTINEIIDFYHTSIEKIFREKNTDLKFYSNAINELGLSMDEARVFLLYIYTCVYNGMESNNTEIKDFYNTHFTIEFMRELHDVIKKYEYAMKYSIRYDVMCNMFMVSGIDFEADEFIDMCYDGAILTDINNKYCYIHFQKSYIEKYPTIISYYV